jgi:hypothetical protein
MVIFWIHFFTKALTGLFLLEIPDIIKRWNQFPNSAGLREPFSGECVDNTPFLKNNLRNSKVTHIFV